MGGGGEIVRPLLSEPVGHGGESGRVRYVGIQFDQRDTEYKKGIFLFPAASELQASDILLAQVRVSEEEKSQFRLQRVKSPQPCPGFTHFTLFEINEINFPTV